jgi:transposase-like protein
MRRMTTTANPPPLPATLDDASEYFANPDRSRRYLAAKRWPQGIVCPRCGSKTVYFDSSRRGWECRTRHPRRRFTVKTGTMFEESRLGFDKWLPAIWLIANHASASARTIARTVGVTERTAWFMRQRVRLALQEADPHAD